MNKLDLGPIGMTVPVSADGRYLEQAAAVEDLGYSALWLRGGQLDSLSRITEVVRATKAVPVIPGIIPVDVYSSGDVIRLYGDLEASAPGRFIVGLGGPQVPRPLGPLNDYLDRLDGLDRLDELDRLDGLGRGEPPVPAGRRILAALGPRKLEIARERAAGAVLLLVTPDYVRAARQILGTSATLIVSQMVVRQTDAARGREAARVPLRFLSGVPGYRASFARMGFTGTDIDGLSADLVDDLVTWGSADVIAARVGEYLRAGADHVALTVLDDDGGSATLDSARLLARCLRPASGRDV